MPASRAISTTILRMTTRSSAPARRPAPCATTASVPNLGGRPAPAILERAATPREARDPARSRAAVRLELRAERPPERRLLVEHDEGVEADGDGGGIHEERCPAEHQRLADQQGEHGE